MPEVPVVRIRSTHPESQGDFVEINESDYDPEMHTLIEGEKTKRGPGRPKKTEAEGS